MDLPYWMSATICITVRRLHSERLRSWYWRIFPQEDLEEIILWCIEVGLPVTLAELGAGKVTDEQLMEVATTACAENDTLHNMPFEVTPETVFAAIKAADAYGRYYLDEE